MSEELRQQIEAAIRQAEEGIAERNRLIRQAHADGASLRELAALVGMTHTGIRKIIHKGEP